MSLQDEHLKQALQSAPDRDLAPSDAVRQQVLDYANNAAPKPAGWLHRFKAWRVSSWQLVGMSALASVFLVTIMLRPQLPKEPVWVGTDTEEIAQVDEVEVKGANVAPEITLALPNEDELFSPTVDDRLDAPLESDVAAEPTVPLRKETKKKAAVAIQEERIELAEIPKAAEVFSDEGNAIVAEPVATAKAEADAVEPVMADKVADTESRQMESRPSAAKASVAARKSASPLSEKVSGVSLAKEDIQAGNFRILFNAAAGKSLVDDETGFRMEPSSNTGLSDVEVEAYNQTMRHWYRSSKGLAD